MGSHVEGAAVPGTASLASPRVSAECSTDRKKVGPLLVLGAHHLGQLCQPRRRGESQNCPEEGSAFALLTEPGRSTACAPPAACLPGRTPGSQVHALQDSGWPQPQPGPPPACALLLHLRAGSCGLTLRPRAEASSSGTSSSKRMRTTPRKSILQPLRSAVGARASRSASLD